MCVEGPLNGLGAVDNGLLPLLVKLVESMLVPTLIGFSIRAFVPGNGRMKAGAWSNEGSWQALNPRLLEPWFQLQLRWR